MCTNYWQPVNVFIEFLSATQQIRTRGQLPGVDTNNQTKLTIINTFAAGLSFGSRRASCFLWRCSRIALLLRHFSFTKHTEHRFIRSLFKEFGWSGLGFLSLIFSILWNGTCNKSGTNVYSAMCWCIPHKSTYIHNWRIIPARHLTLLLFWQGRALFS